MELKNINNAVNNNQKETNSMESIKSIKDINEVIASMDVKADPEKQAFVKKTLQNNCDYSQIECQKLILAGGNYDISQDVEGYLDVEPMGMNDTTRRYREMAHKKVMSTAYLRNSVRVVNNVLSRVPFTEECMLIDAHGLNNRLGMDIAEAVTKHFITVKYIPDEKKAVLCFRTSIETEMKEHAGDMYLFIEVGPEGSHTKHFVVMEEDDGTQKSKMVVYWNALKNKNGETRTYGFDYAGPGNFRQGTYFVYLVHEGETRVQFMARMLKEFNDLTGGYVSTLGEAVEAQGGMAREKLFKANSRISLCWTPMTPLFSMKTFAYYNGSLGLGFGDGQWLFDGQLLADQRKLPIEGVLGLAYQARIIHGVINKGMAIALSHLDMAVVAASYGKGKHVSFKKFRELWIAGKLQSDVMYFVGGKCPGAIFDENSMKGVGMEPENGEFVFNLMSVKDATQGKLNIQDAMAMAHLPGAAEMIGELGKEYADKKFEENIDRVLRGELKDEIDYFDEDIEEAKKNGEKLEYTTKVVNPDQYFPGMVASIAPMQAAHDAKIFMENVKDTARGLVRDISKLNFEVEGDEYRTFQSDYAGMILGKGVLGDRKIYMPGEKGGKTKTIDRCPKVDIYEFFRSETEWLNVIISDLEEMKKTDSRANLINVVEHLYINADTALVITPCNPAFANATGGSDDDGDGGACRGNEKLNKVQLQQGDGSNTIPKAKASGVVVEHYDIEVAQQMFIGGLYGQADANGNRMAPTPVGIVANHATTISALITGDEEVLEIVLEEVVIPAVKALGYESDGHLYERRWEKADVYITDEMVIDATEDFYTSDLSLESFKNALMDANRMGASVEGRVIDMAKNADLVHSGYLGVLEKKDLCGDGIKMRGGMTAKAYDTVKYEPKFVRDAETGVTTMELEPTTKINPEKTILVRSSLSDVRDGLLQYVKDKVNGYLALEINPSNVENKLMHNIADPSQGCVCQPELKMAKLVNDQLTGNGDLSSDEKKVVRGALANTVRWMFKPGTPASWKFFQVRKAAAMNNKKVAYNSFEYVLPQEYMQGVLYIAKNNKWKVNDTLIGYPAFAVDSKNVNDGDVVTFSHGSSDNGIVTSKKADGEWTMRVIKGKLYATRTAEQIFAVPETDNRVVLLANDYKPAQDENDVDAGYKIHTEELRGEELSLRVGDQSSIVGDIEGSDEMLHFYTPRCGKKNGKQLGVVMDFVYGGGKVKMTQVVQTNTVNAKGEKTETTIVCGNRVDGDGKPVAQSQKVASLKAKLNMKISMPVFH